jgi:hypothetical protein
MTKIIKIEELLDRSARRVLSEAQLEPDPELVAQGWERRFTADPQRAQEAMELYAQLGYDVRVEPVRSVELADNCEGCYSTVALGSKTIYTRKKTN